MIKEGFVLRKIGGTNLVLPAGALVKSFGALVLNDTGASIFCSLQQGKTVEESAQALVDEFDVSIDKARADVIKTVDALREAEVIAEGQ